MLIWISLNDYKMESDKVGFASESLLMQFLETASFFNGNLNKILKLFNRKHMQYVA